MNPQQRPCCVPLLKCAALDKPLGRSIVLSSMSNVVIVGRIWWGEPTPDILLQMVTFEAQSVPMILQVAEVMAHVSSCLSHLSFLES